MINKVAPSFSYDKILNVMTVDLTNVVFETSEDVEKGISLFIQFTDSLPIKAYCLVNWSNCKLSPVAAPIYGTLIQQVLPKVKAIFRYGQLDIFSKLNVTAQAVTNHYQANFYPNREEALNAVLKHIAEEKEKK